MTKTATFDSREQEITKRENGRLTTDEMRQALLTDQTSRELACAEAVKAALKEFECDILAIPFLAADGRIEASVTIKAK